MIRDARLDAKIDSANNTIVKKKNFFLKKN